MDAHASEALVNYPAAAGPLQTTCITLCYFCLKPWGAGQAIMCVAGHPKLCGCDGCVTRFVRRFNMQNAPSIAQHGGRAGAAGGKNGRVLRSSAGLS